MGKAEDQEMQYEAEVDRLTAGCPGIYTTKQLEDKMRWERTGIDLDAFAAADDFEVYHRRGHITTASIMRMARLTRSQREVLRLTVGARRRGVRLSYAAAARKLNRDRRSVSDMVARIRERIMPVINSLDTPYHNDLEWLFRWEIAWKKRQIYHKRITRKKLKNPRYKIIIATKNQVQNTDTHAQTPCIYGKQIISQGLG